MNGSLRPLMPRGPGADNRSGD